MPSLEAIDKARRNYNLPADVYPDVVFLDTGGDPDIADYYGFPEIQAQDLAKRDGITAKPAEQISSLVMRGHFPR